jgi:2,5-diketo-D-gluconate reductase A
MSCVRQAIKHPLLVAITALAAVVALIPTPAHATFSAQGAAAWALKCWNNQCPSCTCIPETSGPHKGFCPGSGASPSCGCTPFVSHALREGGGWNHAQVNVCSQLNSILSASSYWTNVGTQGGRIIAGDVVVMTPPKDPPMGHCCIGTAAGKMTCHNRNHKDVTVDGYGTVNAIWRHSPPYSTPTPALQAVAPALAPAIDASAPRVEIAPGVNMPFINLGGVLRRPSNYSSWLELGGRGLDTALTYGDEIQHDVADALKTTKVPREDIFVTAKIPCLPCSSSKHCGEAGESNAAQDILKDIAILGKPVNLILLHWPCDTLDETVAFYQQLEAALARGDTRAIGVSNFNHSMLEALISRTKVKPAVNQCGHSIGAHDKMHNPMYGGDDPTVRYCQDHGISYSAYSPLGGLTGTDIWKNPTVQAIAKAHGGISPAQVALRFLVQQNITVVTAAMNPAYQREDMDVFSFSLTEAEMVELAGLN